MVITAKYLRANKYRTRIQLLNEVKFDNDKLIKNMEYELICYNKSGRLTKLYAKSLVAELKRSILPALIEGGYKVKILENNTKFIYIEVLW